MCGIAGVISIDDSRALVLEHMLNQLSHRGPDDRGFLVGPDFAFGMTRLAVVNVNNGNQPVVNFKKNLVVVFNGEIYNFREIISQFNHLFQDYYNLRDVSEATLINVLFENFGKSFVTLLRGMFAIAIWDMKNDKLFLIRDRFGEKPLYYLHQQDRLIFASEIRAFWNMRSNFSVDTNSLYDLFEYGYILNNHTIFKEITSVRPATILEFHKGQLVEEVYWKHDVEKKVSCNDSQAMDLLHSSIMESVKLQSYSERNSGVYLSGGVDSSLIAFYLQQIAYEPIKSFSVGFRESLFDETSIAKSVSDSIGTLHHSFQLNPTPENLFQCLLSLDQPFADSSYVPSYFLNKSAHDSGVVVAFGGDGGDESFLGYDRYRAILLAQKFSLPLSLAKILLGKLKIKDSRFSKFFNLKSSYSDLYSLYNELVQLNGFDVYRNVFKQDLIPRGRTLLRYSFLENLEELIEFDLNSYLPGDILFKTDRASMSHSVELRSPFLDHKYFELASSLPTSLRIRNLNGKFLMKKLVSQKIPQVNFFRSKMGFGIPRAKWLRGEYLNFCKNILLDEECQSRGWFDSKFLRVVIHEHENGIDRDSIIWPALVTEFWAKNWLR